MTLPDLMDALDAHSATLIRTGDSLKVRAPAALPDALMADLRAHKAEILAAWQAVRRSRWSIFTREQVSEVAFHEHRASGFPYRRLSVARCMLEINKLAATPTEKLLGSQLAYQVADTYHPQRFHATTNRR
jgi:hypothetical protein